MDHRTNTHGLRLIDLCKNNNIFILNGRLSSEKAPDILTFRNKSTIDYVIASSQSFHFLTNFQITETDPLFSDGHCVLNWSIDIPETDSPNLTNLTNTCPTRSSTRPTLVHTLKTIKNSIKKAMKTINLGLVQNALKRALFITTLKMSTQKIKIKTTN